MVIQHFFEKTNSLRRIVTSSKSAEVVDNYFGKRILTNNDLKDV